MALRCTYWLALSTDLFGGACRGGSTVSLVLLFFHPVWYFGGGGGDCGRWFVQLAEYLMIGVIGLLVLQIVLWRSKRTRNDRSGAELGRAAERAQGS